MRSSLRGGKENGEKRAGEEKDENERAPPWKRRTSEGSGGLAV